MMIMLSPDVLDRLIQDRRHELQGRTTGTPVDGRALRVRLGRALIAAGTALADERAEHSSARAPLPRAA